MKSSTVAGLILLFAGTAAAQDTTWHKLDDTKLPDRLDAEYYAVESKDTDDLSTARIDKWYISGQKYSEAIYSGVGTVNVAAKVTEWYPNGQKKAEYAHENWRFVGLLETWWDNGQQRRRDFYDTGELVDWQCWDVNGNPVEHYLYIVFPEFRGGPRALQKFLSFNIEYPRKARNARAQGIVYLSFVIEKDGKVTDARIVVSVNELLDAEALRVVNNMPNWIPGKKEGEPMKMQFNLPVRFSLK